MSIKCYYCKKELVRIDDRPIQYRVCESKDCQRKDLIDRIEQNDPEILGQLADLILMQEGSPVLPEVKCTTKELNNIIRKQVKR